MQGKVGKSNLPNSAPTNFLMGVARVDVPTDFDTKGKALSGAKAAEKGLK